MARGEKIPREVLNALALRSDGRCEIRLGGCTWRACDPHHRKLRSRGGSNTLTNLLHACRHCHDLVTSPRDPIPTERYRTYSHQKEGAGEDGVVWQPKNREDIS